MIPATTPDTDAAHEERIRMALHGRGLDPERYAQFVRERDEKRAERNRANRARRRAQDR